MIRKEIFCHLLILLIALGCQSVGQAQDTAQLKAQVKEIADADWQYTLEQNIFLRLKYGLPIKKLPDISVEQAGRDADYARSLIRKIDAVPKQRLDHEDALTLDILRWQAQNAVEEQKYYWLMFPVTPYVAGQSLNFIHQVLAGHRFKTADDLANYLGLADEYAAQLDQMLAKLKGQDRKGVRLPKPELPAVVALFSAHRANSEKIFSVASPRFSDLADAATSDFQVRLQAAIRERINPAFDRLIAFLQGDYEQRAPETVGYSQYPGGKAYYRYLVRLHTTLNLTPEQVHEIGLKRVEELSRQMQQIRDGLGFKGSQAEFHQMLRTNPRFLAKTPAEVEERYMSYIRRMEPLIARYFAKTPKASYGVKRLNPAVEASMTFGYYQPPTPDNPIGQYHYNGSQLQDRSLVMAGPLIYHELIPGHHFHLASQNENTELPMARREFLLAGAFNEGWGNYGAGLAAEAGLLDDPYDRYGKAIFDMFISVRLVVDTGMNCFGWPLQPDRKLSFDPPRPTTQRAFDSFISDPANPVPYRQRPIDVRSGWTTWLVEDQRFVDHRPDVLSWMSDPLNDDVVVSGKIVANLFAATTGTDSDWIVKLIDVYPEKYTPDPKMGGYQLMIAGDVARGRYRSSFEKPEPIVPGSVTRYEIGFPANDHVFLKGHRIMVQVQSTWFPVIDRNPQRFVPNIFLAKDSGFQRATQRVFRSGRHASHIAVPVVEPARQ